MRESLLVGLDAQIQATCERVLAASGTAPVVAADVSSAVRALDAAQVSLVVVSAGSEAELVADCRALRSASASRNAVILAYVRQHERIDLDAVLDAGASDFVLAAFGEGVLRSRLRMARRAASAAAVHREIALDRQQFFLMSLDMLCTAGFDGYFKSLNPSWTTTLGWTLDELLAKPWLEFVHPEDVASTIAASSRLSTGTTVISFSNRYQCKDGTYRWLDWNAAPSVARGLVYAVVRDLTVERNTIEAKKLAQNQLVLADRLASVGTLAAGIAHEINNPLSYVTANLDMIIEEVQALAGGSASGRMKDLEEMALEAREGSDRVRKIVRGLKTLSRADEERRTVIDVKPVLEMSINMAFNEIRHRARLVKDYGQTLLVEADDARLGQVFINLLVNAAQALPENGVEHNEIRIVTSTDAQGRVVVEVRDNGPGIPPQVLGRIFDPFFTTKPVGIGTGLGLSICHNIVTGMGGEITVHSTEGCGTTFRVALPASANQISPPEASSRERPAEGRAGAVLVVDDEPSVGIMLSRVLRDHAVTVVTSGSEALDLLAAGTRFDVILSDLMMPEMSGMEFYEALVRRFPEASERVVFVTGGAFTSGANAFLDRVPNERVEKPFDPKRVRALVQKFVR